MYYGVVGARGAVKFQVEQGPEYVGGGGAGVWLEGILESIINDEKEWMGASERRCMETKKEERKKEFFFPFHFPTAES